MSRRVNIDRINSKYRGSSIISQPAQPIGVLGGVGTVGTVATGGRLTTLNSYGGVGAVGGLGAVGGVTAVRRSTVSPSVVYGGPSGVRTSGLPIAGQTLVSGVDTRGSVLYPATNTQTIVRRSRVDLYPSLTGPSVVVAPTPVVIPGATTVT